MSEEGLTDSALPSHHHPDLFLVVDLDKTDVLTMLVFHVLQLRTQKRICRACGRGIRRLEDEI